MARAKAAPELTEEAEEVKAEIVSGNIKVHKAKDYIAMHEADGTPFGRQNGEKTELSIEELRVLINENWTPEMIKSKHGLNDEELKQLVWKLSRAEMRDTPIKFGRLSGGN